MPALNITSRGVVRFMQQRGQEGDATQFEPYLPKIAAMQRNRVLFYAMWTLLAAGFAIGVYVNVHYGMVRP